MFYMFQLFSLVLLGTISCSHAMLSPNLKKKVTHVAELAVQQNASFSKDIAPLLRAEVKTIRALDEKQCAIIVEYLQKNAEAVNQSLVQVHQEIDRIRPTIKYSPDGKSVSLNYKKLLDKSAYLEKVGEKLLLAASFISTVHKK